VDANSAKQHGQYCFLFQVERSIPQQFKTTLSGTELTTTVAESV
jgi:hypothetical protein